MNNSTTHGKLSMVRKYGSVILPLMLLVLDYCAIISAEHTAFYLRNAIISTSRLRLTWFMLHIAAPFTYILFTLSLRLYTRRMQFWRQIAVIFKAHLYSFVTLVLFLYIYHVAGQTSRLFMGFLAIFAFVYVVLIRFAVGTILCRFGFMQTPTLVMGAGKTAAIVLQYLQKDIGVGCHFIGFLEDNEPNAEVAAQLPYLGKFDDAEDVIRKTGVSSVLVAAPGLDTAQVQDVVYRIQPMVRTVSFIPDMSGLPLGTMDIESLIDGHIVAFKFRNNLHIRTNRIIKRAFDLVCTAAGCVFAVPLMAIIAVCIKIDSPGPAIFKHRRIGRYGREFDCYKFRSMCVDSDEKLKQLLADDPRAREEWEKEFKLKNDPRVTRVGAFLRKTSLDELPQVFNVLKGEMSLVGPRPIIRKEIERYGRYIEDYYMVLPGITGIWQTSGRSDISYDERVQMDTWYVRNWNVWFDIVLLWRTVQVVLGRKGAY